MIRFIFQEYSPENFSGMTGGRRQRSNIDGGERDDGAGGNLHPGDLQPLKARHQWRCASLHRSQSREAIEQLPTIGSFLTC